MRKKKSTGITSNISSSVTSSKAKRQKREGLTRVGIVTSPIKGTNTHAMQWNRWTP